MSMLEFFKDPFGTKRIAELRGEKTVTLFKMQQLKTQLDFMTRRAYVAEKQLNDVVMTASIKLATARMVLNQIHDKSGQLGMAIQGVLDALPKPDAPTQKRLR